MANILKEVSNMDKEMKEMLTWINDNLKAVVVNQEEIYCRLSEIENEIGKSDPAADKED